MSTSSTSNILQIAPLLQRHSILWLDAVPKRRLTLWRDISENGLQAAKHAMCKWVRKDAGAENFDKDVEEVLNVRNDRWVLADLDKEKVASKPLILTNRDCRR